MPWILLLESHCRESTPEGHLQEQTFHFKGINSGVLSSHIAHPLRRAQKIKVIIYLLQEPQWQKRDQLVSNSSFQELNLDMNEV